MTYGAFFIFLHFGQHFLLGSLGQSSEVEHNPKMNEHLIFWWLRGPFTFFCVLVNIFCSDHLADHQKLNIIQKWTFYFLITQGAFFIFLHFSRHFLLGLLGRSSKVEHNPKTNIFFQWLRGPFSFFCILINILCSDCLADHQKLNIIQKWTFDFSMA